jgi:thiamine biosynthesis lipoprotein
MKRCQPILGTFVEITIHDKLSGEELSASFDLAFQAIHRINYLMSFYEANSDLSRINRHAFDEAVLVDPLTFQVLLLAKELFIQTDGAFDCSIGHTLQNWGLLPNSEYVHEEYGDLNDLILLDGFKVSYAKPLVLDLGGLAKGFAVDQAIEVLKNLKIKKALVNAGGDLRVLGDELEDIFIRKPSDPQTLIKMGQLSDGALASSGIYYSKNRSIDQAHSALVIPKTQKSILEEKSFTVIAPTCVLADGLTKALAIHQNTKASYFEKYNAHGVIL